ncbi:MAG: zinc ribbon domain-containing protein [Bacteroidota bacterium]
MGYVTENLAPGEQVVHRARLHWKIFFVPIVIAITALICFSLASSLAWGNREAATIIGTVGTLLLIWAGLRAILRAINLATSEFAVTDRRLIMKWGVFRRESIDIRLMQMESLLVEQRLLAHILDYGTIIVVGSGGTRQSTPDISDPFAFRLNAQSQSGHFQSFDPSSSSTPIGANKLRECPYCAEPILTKARVCKHCGRDVEPLLQSASQTKERAASAREQQEPEKTTPLRHQTDAAEKDPVKRTLPADQELKQQIYDLEELYSAKSDDELKRIVEHEEEQYTRLAISVIRKELQKRGYEIVEENAESKSAETVELLCPSCGRVNESGTKFCIFCGTFLQQASNKLGLCPNCKASNPPSAKYCNECGHHLKMKESDT